MGTGYNGFRKTIIKRATLEDTLQNMQRMAIRDQDQVVGLASSFARDPGDYPYEFGVYLRMEGM